MKYRKSKILAISITIFCLLLLAAYALLPSTIPKDIRNQITDAFQNATSVQLIPCEYKTTEGNLHLHYHEERAVVLNKTDMQECAAVFNQNLFFQGKLTHMRCFTPHHVIRIESKKENSLEIIVCFECNNMRVGASGKILPTPPAWESGLKQLFRKHGLTDYLD